MSGTKKGESPSLYVSYSGVPLAVGFLLACSVVLSSLGLVFDILWGTGSGADVTLGAGENAGRAVVPGTCLTVLLGGIGGGCFAGARLFCGVCVMGAAHMCAGWFGVKTCIGWRYVKCDVGSTS